MLLYSINDFRRLREGGLPKRVEDHRKARSAIATLQRRLTALERAIEKPAKRR